MNQNDSPGCHEDYPSPELRRPTRSIMWAVGEELARKLAERDDTQCSYGNTIVAV